MVALLVGCAVANFGDEQVVLSFSKNVGRPHANNCLPVSLEYDLMSDRNRYADSDMAWSRR